MLKPYQIEAYAKKTTEFLTTPRGRDVVEIAALTYPDNELAQRLAIVQAATGLHVHDKLVEVADTVAFDELEARR